MEDITNIDLKLLILDISNVKIGIDVDHIKSMTIIGNMAHEEINAYDIRKILYLDAYSKHEYKSPRVLHLKGIYEETVIIIDDPYDIITVSVDNIHPLPFLVESYNKTAVWAIALHNFNGALVDDIVLLVDFYKLIK